MKEKLLISACLCGKNTKYNGGNNLISNLGKIEENFELFLVCPESDGGLTTPRNPSEQQGEKVVSNKGVDVTTEFNLGAKIALDVALKNNIKYALLKESSPSCGTNLIYDGTFSGKKINGMGVAAKLLKENGILVFSENETKKLLKIIGA
jgi:uncharacterized protein YbbK (DUF523 family)